MSTLDNRKNGWFDLKDKLGSFQFTLYDDAGVRLLHSRVCTSREALLADIEVIRTVASIPGFFTIMQSAAGSSFQLKIAERVIATGEWVRDPYAARERIARVAACAPKAMLMDQTLERPPGFTAEEVSLIEESVGAAFGHMEDDLIVLASNTFPRYRVTVTTEEARRAIDRYNSVETYGGEGI